MVPILLYVNDDQVTVVTFKLSLSYLYLLPIHPVTPDQQLVGLFNRLVDLPYATAS